MGQAFITRQVIDPMGEYTTIIVVHGHSTKWDPDGVFVYT